ncbi:CDP-glycerol glycerophosphotransferase family protein [Candidatus Sumerlaeota bacterium]|nr:CDP-glycerol glycerophosphotransferase family protein [Candidatus Sumerlaeota bacterium]
MGMSAARKDILFYANAPNNYVCFRPLFEALRRDDRLRVWLASTSVVLPRSRDFYASLGVEHDRVIPRWRARWQRFDLYVSPNIAVIPRRARTRVQMFHGVSFKGKPYTDSIRKYDYLFTVGPYMKRRFARDGFFEEGDPRLLEIGMPKTDALFHPPKDRAAVARELGFDDPSQPLVLYAPTWRKESSLYGLGRELLRELPRRGRNLMVKLHDHHYDPKSNPVDWRAEWPRLRHPRLGVIEDPDIVPYMAAADVLISDLSSVTNEFTLLDRPIVFIDVPELRAKYGQTLDMEEWGQKTGTVVKSMEELIAAIDQAIAQPALLSDVRQAAARDLFFHPGRATQAAIQGAYRVLGIPAPGSSLLKGANEKTLPIRPGIG